MFGGWSCTSYFTSRLVALLVALGQREDSSRAGRLSHCKVLKRTVWRWNMTFMCNRVNKTWSIHMLYGHRSSFLLFVNQIQSNLLITDGLKVTQPLNLSSRLSRWWRRWWQSEFRMRNAGWHHIWYTIRKKIVQILMGSERNASTSTTRKGENYC